MRSRNDASRNTPRLTCGKDGKDSVSIVYSYGTVIWPRLTSLDYDNSSAISLWAKLLNITDLNFVIITRRPILLWFALAQLVQN